MSDNNANSIEVQPLLDRVLITITVGTKRVRLHLTAERAERLSAELLIAADGAKPVPLDTVLGGIRL